MKLSELQREIEGAKMIGKDVEITSLCCDSRVSGAGDMFFCFQGTNTDAHAFAREAVLRGAVAILCEKPLDLPCSQLVVKEGREGMSRVAAAFYAHPEKKLKIVGITGTNGKTTTSHMIFSIFEESGKKAGLIGTLGAKYGDTFVAPTLTTPDPVFLFSLLADMVKAGVEIVVLEVSAHALALKKELPVCYDTAVFTNLTHDHLDFFKDMHDYGNAKKQLFLPNRCRFAVLNFDDAFSREIMKEGTPYISYGLENPADAFALVERENVKESEVLLNLNDELIEAKIPLTGRHNVYNALAAACTCRRMGVRASAIARGLAKTSVSGRLEWVANVRGAEIFVDFAHTPDGLKQSLTALRSHCAGKLVVVFGCGGNRDRKKRPEMGETVAQLCNFAVITSDNPRYEDTCAIMAEIEKGYRLHSKEYVLVEEREGGIAYGIKCLQEGDILLVAGKGGETYQEIMGIKYAYNDKDTIKNILDNL